MDLDTIFSRFLFLCNLSPEDGDNYRFLCNDASEYLISIAKSKDAVNENEAGFCTAAAALAALNYFMLKNGEAVSSFTAGDVSLRLEANGANAGLREYFAECIKRIRPLLRDDSFIFEAV